MRTFDAIEQYSSNLFGRLVGCLQARGKADPVSRIDIADGPADNWPIERPDCGGYNEAYVMHCWASFTPDDRERR